MAKKESSAVAKSKARVAKPKPAGLRSAAIIAEGDVADSFQFARWISACMSDLTLGAMSPEVGNSNSAMAGKLLKLTELRLKYGPKGGGSLPLIGP